MYYIYKYEYHHICGFNVFVLFDLLRLVLFSCVIITVMLHNMYRSERYVHIACNA